MGDEPLQTGQPETSPAEPVESPDYLDPRFKTVEDQARAYKEAEKKMQQEAQRRAELERQNQELLGRVQQPPQAAPPAEPPVNEDQLFWEKPTEVMKRIVGQYVSPFVDDRYEMQKTQFRQDPNFAKYEPEIDQMIRMQPELKQKPTVVSDLYKIIRARDFDPVTERERIKAEIMAEMQGKAAAGLEAPGSPPVLQAPPVELTAEEKRAALGIYGNVPQEEAFKKYADAKTRYHARG